MFWVWQKVKRGVWEKVKRGVWEKVKKGVGKCIEVQGKLPKKRCGEGEER